MPLTDTDDNAHASGTWGGNFSFLRKKKGLTSLNGGEVSCRDGGDRGCPSSRVSRCAQLDGRNAGEASTLQEAGQGEAEAGAPAALLAGMVTGGAGSRTALLAWAAALALPLIVVAWRSRRACADPNARTEERAQRALSAAMEKRERKERKEARSARAQAAAEEKLRELTSRLDAALAQPPEPPAETLLLASVDVEAWEGNSKLITEIGLAFCAVGGGRCAFRHRHIIIQEHLTLRNGTFVEDNRGMLAGRTHAARAHAFVMVTCTLTHAHVSLSLAL